MIEEVNQRGAECIEKCKEQNELSVYKEWCASMIISMSRSIQDPVILTRVMKELSHEILQS